MAHRRTPLYMKALNLTLIFAGLVGLSACATVDVSSRNQLLSRKDISEKECYSYDTQKESIARYIKTALPLGIVSLMLGPIGPIVSGVGNGIAMQVDSKMLPTRCGLTVDEAIREASTMAFMKDSTAIWRQLRAGGSLTLKATPLYPRGACSVQSLEITKEPRGEQSKRYSERIEVCKDKNGTPVITQHPAPREETPKLYARETAVSNLPAADNTRSKQGHQEVP